MSQPLTSVVIVKEGSLFNVHLKEVSAQTGKTVVATANFESGLNERGAMEFALMWGVDEGDLIYALTEMNTVKTKAEFGFFGGLVSLS